MSEFFRVAIPPKKQLRLIEWHKGAWRIWTDTIDFKYGTFIKLYADGRVERVTIRVGQADDILIIRSKKNVQISN